MIDYPKIEKILGKADQNFRAEKIKPGSMEAVYRLRYRIFHDILKWIPSRNNNRDVDNHDIKAIHFGIFDSEKLVGCCRLIPSKECFMIEREFKGLVNNFFISKYKNTAEVSRLAISNDLGFVRKFQVAMVLYRAMYRWSLKRGIRYWYLVTDFQYFKSLVKLFSCRRIGRIKYYQHDTPTIASLLDLKKSENKIKDFPILYNWFVLSKGKDLM